MITSQEKTILIQKEDGQRQEVQVRKIEKFIIIIIDFLNLRTTLCHFQNTCLSSGENLE